MRSTPPVEIDAVPAPRRSRLPGSVLRFACSAAALLWIVHGTPLNTIAVALHRADWRWLLLGMVLNILVRVAAAERTLVISRALGLGVTRRQTLETLFISNYYALLSPGPLLSGVVSVYRYKSQGASITASVATLLGSRAIEAGVFVVLGAACVLMDSRIPLAAIRIPLSIALAAVIVIGIGLIGWSLLHRRCTGLQTSGRMPEPRSDSWFSKLLVVWHELTGRGPRIVWEAAVPAAAQVILSGAAVSLLARALDIDLGLDTAIWISAAVYAVVLLPISFAGLGVRDITLIKSFGLLGLAPPLAVALSVLLFADPLLNALIGGLWQMTSIWGAAREPA